MTEREELVKLLPCPFCGGEGVVYDDGEDCIATCNNADCPALPASVGNASISIAAERWNRRASLTAAQPDGKCIAPPCKCNDSNRGVCAYWHPSAQPDAEQAAERKILQLIDERDAAEAAISQAYYLVTGNSPEWSNHFSHDDALDEIRDAMTALKSAVQKYQSAPPSGAREGMMRAADDELLKALRFYANGHHFDLSGNPDAWDTVSGEPQNYYCDEAGTATVEDGSIAKQVLLGQKIDWNFEGEDCTPKPIDAEAIRAAAAKLPPGYTDIDDVIKEAERDPVKAAALQRARERLAANVQEGDSEGIRESVRKLNEQVARDKAMLAAAMQHSPAKEGK